MNETTDHSAIKKQCAFTVIYIDEVSSSVKTSFFEIKEVALKK